MFSLFAIFGHVDRDNFKNPTACFSSAGIGFFDSFVMSDSIDTITELEAIENDAQAREAFRRYKRRTDSLEEKQDKRMVAEKRLTSSSERILSACTGAILTSLLGKAI